jgi:hypothetical protein
LGLIEASVLGVIENFSQLATASIDARQGNADATPEIEYRALVLRRIWAPHLPLSRNSILIPDTPSEDR